MTTFFYVFRRCFCLCPWEAYSLWLAWKSVKDDDFVKTNEGPLSAIDAYAADDFGLWWESPIMLVARPINAVRHELARLWHPISRWRNNRKWERWTRENLS